MKNKVTRRAFGKVAILACSGVAIVGSSAVLAPRLMAAEDNHLRLPGAEKEKKFLGTCIKCGQCLQVCPYHSVKLLDINHGVLLGTPVIVPNERGCYLCDLLPCVLACPSGALNHDISEPRQVKMGKAVVVSPDTCFGQTGELVTQDHIAVLISHGVKSEEEKELAEKLQTYMGKPCTICRDICPYPDRDEAISLTEGDKYIPVIKDKCVGCGVCTELCPASKNVFKIVPVER